MFEDGAKTLVAEGMTMTYNQKLILYGLLCGILLAVLLVCEWATAANC